MKEELIKVLVLGFVLVLSFSFSPGLSQETPDLRKIMGAWDIEVDADGEYYYLSMSIEKSEEGLKGTISESTGAFSDVPLSNIEYDGQTLKFTFNSPTPPDGIERLVKAEFKVGDNKLEGLLTVEDLEATATATATRKAK